MIDDNRKRGLDALRSQLDSKPVAAAGDFFEFKEGDEVLGAVIERSTATSQYGDFEILTIETSEGPVKVGCGRTVLKNAISKHDPQPGDLIGIRYVGFTGDYHDYNVAVEHTERPQTVHSDEVPF